MASTDATVTFAVSHLTRKKIYLEYNSFAGEYTNVSDTHKT
jgi:hypothetical protein